MIGHPHCRATCVAAGVTIVSVLVLVPPARATRDPEPWSAACVQAAETPLAGGWYLDSSVTNAMVGSRCVYRATHAGGYEAPLGDDWRVLIDRSDGSWVVFAAGRGSPRCADAVIEPGDRVEIASSTTIAAGSGFGCS